MQLAIAVQGYSGIENFYGLMIVNTFHKIFVIDFQSPTNSTPHLEFKLRHKEAQKNLQQLRNKRQVYI